MWESIKAFFGFSTEKVIEESKVVTFDAEKDDVDTMVLILKDLNVENATLHDLNYYDTSKTGRVVPIDALVSLYEKSLEEKLEYNDVYLRVEVQQKKV